MSSTPKWDVFEATFSGPSSGNPHLEVNFEGLFAFGARSLRVPGFYDGDGRYKLRFMPDSEGAWTYQTISNRPELNGLAGGFDCSAGRPNMHGPVQVRNRFHFAHADGTPYFPIAAQPVTPWTYQPLEMQTGSHRKR